MSTLPVAKQENRRIERIALPLTVQVEVKIDGGSSWNEITRLHDVSAFGAGFMLKRPTKRGRLMMLTIPMPRQLRCYDYSEPQYKIWGVVRSCIETTKDSATLYAVGVAFVGPEISVEHANRSSLVDVEPPDATSGDFWRLVERDADAGDADRRGESRFLIPESLTVELLDENSEPISQEETVSENISAHGAVVFTHFFAEAGTFLRVVSRRLNLEILSVVRAARVGEDGLSRLHLEFVDRVFPLEGLS